MCAEAESLSSASSDAEGITAPSQVNNSLVLSDQAEDQSEAPDPAEASVSGGDLKDEHQEGSDDLKQVSSSISF